MQPESTQAHDAHFLLADALVSAGEPSTAADKYRAYLSSGTFITAYVNQSIGLAEAYADQNGVDAAVNAYQQFVESDPAHSRAPEALWKAAQLLERDGQLEAAAEAYMGCHVRYPNSDDGAPALFRSGLQFCRLGHAGRPLSRLVLSSGGALMAGQGASGAGGSNDGVD